MKKSLFTAFASLFFITVVSAQTPEYEVVINDRLSVGTRRAFECVATIANLAGFEEYSQERDSFFRKFHDYFDNYLSDEKVKKAISCFKNERIHGFCYDAVASFATYVSSDCHSFRAPLDIVRKNVDSRCHDLEKMLQAVADFYDAVDFDSFYQSNILKYQEAAYEMLQHKDKLNAAVEALETYYHSPLNKVFLSVSYMNGNGNYGVSFNDGTNVYFEPKYCAGYYDSNLIVHELSHPFSNPLAYKIAKNTKIMSYVNKTFKGDKKKIMTRMAYNDSRTYLVELFNRANTIRITATFEDEEYMAKCLAYDKGKRFDEIEEVSELLKDYQNGNYDSIMDFYPELEKGYLLILQNNSKKK